MISAYPHSAACNANCVMFVVYFVCERDMKTKRVDGRVVIVTSGSSPKSHFQMYSPKESEREKKGEKSLSTMTMSSFTSA